MWIVNSNLELINIDRINKIKITTISSLEQKIMNTTDKIEVVGLVFDGAEDCAKIVIETFSDDVKAMSFVFSILKALECKRMIFETDEWCDDDGYWHHRDEDL